MTLVEVWWKGLSSDHLYEECPALQRSERELKRHGLYGVGVGRLDPEGGDVCGWCVRVWRARSTRNTTLS